VAAQGARTLGDVVDELVDRLVLLAEEFVQVVELRAHDVPVIVAGLGVEDVFVGEQGVQHRDHARAVFVIDTQIGAHRNLLPVQCRRPLEGFASAVLQFHHPEGLEEAHEAAGARHDL
jgi:hypothetical protein